MTSRLKGMLVTEIVLNVWHIEVVVMNWFVMALLVAVVLVSVMSWANRIVHIVSRSLNVIGWVVSDWLGEDCFVVSFRVDVILGLVVNRLLQVHLFSVDRIRPVVLLGCDNIDEMEFLHIPDVWVLVSLVVSLWDVVVVRNPVVLRCVLSLCSRCCWVNPQVLIEVMGFRLVVFNMSWNM